LGVLFCNQRLHWQLMDSDHPRLFQTLAQNRGPLFLLIFLTRSANLFGTLYFFAGGKEPKSKISFTIKCVALFSPLPFAACSSAINESRLESKYENILRYNSSLQ
jgi:hypothetical protein